MLDNSGFSFKPITRDEKAKKDRLNKEMNESTQSASDKLVECLTSGRFNEYLEEYEKAESALVTLGMNIEFADPVLYAMAAFKIFAKIGTLRELRDMVEEQRRRMKV